MKQPTNPQSLGGRMTSDKLGPAGRKARAQAGAAAKWKKHKSIIDAMSERLDGSTLAEIIGDWLATQPEFVDAGMAARPILVRGVLNAFERQQVDRLRRLGFVE